jgi:hypothetical protein
MVRFLGFLDAGWGWVIFYMSSLIINCPTLPRKFLINLFYWSFSLAIHLLRPTLKNGSPSPLILPEFTHTLCYLGDLSTLDTSLGSYLSECFCNTVHVLRDFTKKDSLLWRPQATAPRNRLPKNYTPLPATPLKTFLHSFQNVPPVVYTRKPTDTSFSPSYWKLRSKGHHLQAQGRYLLPSFQTLLAQQKKNPAPGTITDHFKLRDGPYWNKICPENRDIASGPSYINIKNYTYFLNLRTHTLHACDETQRWRVRTATTNRVVIIFWLFENILN